MDTQVVYDLMKTAALSACLGVYLLLAVGLTVRAMNSLAKLFFSVETPVPAMVASLSGVAVAAGSLALWLRVFS